ncbi:Chromosome partition protein Smc [Streptococcus infantarius subsp. infantarius]|nr:Chromosome partition protein Smc [Streptococcus infantarius subsp. infantarius]
MITFLDERDVEHGALATIKVTNAVNGERSLTGEIESGDYVLANIERGWRLRFEDEFYVVTYAKPVDDGKATHVTFDAIHQFFWDFDKSSVHEQLNDGSHTVLNYLDFIFADSGYTYTIDPLLKVYAFEKQSFGYKSRLNLFNDIITASGVEFQVNGKVVRILEKTGTDLSTVVRKNFNMNELGIEKHIGDFVTYQKGFGAWVDENDHTKGRLVTEYTSPLASVYGKLEAEPLVDERYTQADNMIAALKANVDNSYSLSIRLDMEDLTRAGYEYTQPRAGDYIMAINETLDFQEKIRIVSFTSEYDVSGQLVKHEVTCNDIGVVKKLSASYNLTKEQAKNASDSVGKAVEMANKALVSADGKSTVYFGNEFPKDEPKGTLHKGDSLYLTVGDTTKMYYWTGADWEELPIVNDVEAFKEQIADELKDVPNREEFEATITEKLATSKAEIKTQIDTAKTQAESNAKAYADEINQATAEVAEQANAAADALKTDLTKVKTDLTATTSTANSAETSASEAKQQITTVANDLSKAKTDLQNAVSAVDTKATNLQTDLTKAKQDLTNQASQLQAQASAQSELTKRVSSVEETANGTKSTVSELTKTVAQNGKDITSVTARTKTVEDDLTSTKTTLSQVQTTANSASQKTATLETGLDGVKADLATTTVTADTTKTNLANYQASNDKAVANLQSNLQTANGNISSLKTKVEAVPGQITSAVSAVEGKIPTSLDSLNLMTGTRDWSTKTNAWHMGHEWTTESEEYQGLKVHSTQKGYNGSHQNIFVKNGDIVTFSFFAKATNTLSKIKVSSQWNGSSVYQAPLAGVKESDEQITITSEWKRYSKTIHIISDGSLQFRTEYDGSTIPDGNTFYVAGLKLAKSALDTGYSENPTDAASDLSAVSSELKQTKDGMTLLATKTELNSAKTELQSGITAATNKANTAQSTANSNAQTISAHTTQISALNTGLSAKVSQTDFNTLSGRVTTAENNIIAKANELSSKITSVEGKIPTSIGGRNLLTKTNQGKTNWSWAISSGGATAEDWDVDGINAVKLTRTIDSSASWSYIQYKGLLRNLIEPNTKYTLSFDIFPSQDVTFNALLMRGDYTAPLTNSAAMNKATANQWNKLSCVLTSVSTFPDDLGQGIYLEGMPVAKGNYLIIKNIKLEKGVVLSDWQPAPEDYDSKLASAQSEIKQTTDSISASVSSVETKADTAQSTANTAVSKANAAQAGVNTLDSTTVKSASLTINADGIVMKAGKSTTDVANAIGSYFAVNQNAINLFADKINVKGSMIVDGAITSTKIASKSINTAHLNGKIITADVISSNAVTADAIKAGAVTTSAMSANSINGDRITAGTLDAAKIKAGSITASQIASGTITSSQIATGTISAANIAAGAITSDKIASNSIDASKIVANSITADMITGGKLKSTNGATIFDLNGGTLTFNNNYGYIQRVANDKIFEITTWLSNSSDYSQEYLTSAFNIRKSDNSRQAGVKFTLFNTVENKPTAEAKINADAFILYDSKDTRLFSVHGRSTFLGTFNTQDWGDIPVAEVYGGLLVNDIGIGGHIKSLLNIVEELCKKAGILWV